MKSRCGPTYQKRKYYADRGIRVCAEWINSFEQFLAEVGRRPSPRHSLDRYPDNNGNYEPGNVRWATKSQQVRNFSANHLISYAGQTLPLAEMAEIYRIPSGRLQGRLNIGWSVEKALTHPVEARYLKTWAKRKEVYGSNGGSLGRPRQV